MRELFNNSPIFGRNKNELYASFLLMLPASLPLFTSDRSYEQYLTDHLVAVGVLSTACLLTLNALLDIKRMHPVERLIAVPWFCLLAFLMAQQLWDVAPIIVSSHR